MPGRPSAEPGRHRGPSFGGPADRAEPRPCAFPASLCHCESVRVHVLGFHAGYRCRHAGVCCTSRWTIPVDAPLHRTLESALAWGHLRVDGHPSPDDLFQPVEELPHGEPVVLKHRPDGACVFFEPSRGNLCAIQRQMDHAHLPSACRHFPRIVLLDPRGTFITLSHVCPTAARMLIAGGPAEVVANPPGFDAHVVWEGLDARDALPPLVQPGVLWDWDAWDAWERGAVARLAARHGSAEQALGSLAAAVNRLSQWRPGDVPLMDEVLAALIEGAHPNEDPGLTPGAVLALTKVAQESVPALLRPATDEPLPTEAQIAELPGWNAWAPVVGRYLAARAFANWAGYYAMGLRTWYKSIMVAYAVLRSSCARACAAKGHALDESIVVAALGEADHLLMHLVSAADLAAALDAWELEQ
jgi:Fe-S-cluster containining protein